jgi:predicted RNA-binding protein with PUA-like domain
MTSHWLLKTEPSTYSFDRLVAEKRAVWDGVRNNLALIHLRAMKPGDKVLIYHSGAEKAVVGTAKVVAAAYPDPKGTDPKHVVVDVAPDTRLGVPVPLAVIKADPALTELPLIRNSRLSVMPLSAEQWKRIIALGSRT